MSHEIETATFSAREGAGWTGLGLEIPSIIARDPAKIAELTGATWTVNQRPAFYQDENGEFRLIDDAIANVRSDNGIALSVKSKSHYHVANRQPIDVFEAFRDELAAEKLEISHAAVLKGGRVIVVCALLPPEFDINVGGSDKVKSYVTLSTGYKDAGTRCTKGSIRVVCANTYAAAVAAAEQDGRIRSISASTKLEADSLKNLLANAGAMVAAEREQFEVLKNAAIDGPGVARFFADVLGINLSQLEQKDSLGKPLVSGKAKADLTQLLSAYLTAPGATEGHGTAWGAFNAVTYFATHSKTVRDVTGDGVGAARAASNLIGDAAKMKIRAMRLLSQNLQLAVAA